MLTIFTAQKALSPSSQTPCAGKRHCRKRKRTGKRNPIPCKNKENTCLMQRRQPIPRLWLHPAQTCASAQDRQTLQYHSQYYRIPSPLRKAQPSMARRGTFYSPFSRRIALTETKRRTTGFHLRRNKIPCPSHCKGNHRIFSQAKKTPRCVRRRTRNRK